METSKKQETSDQERIAKVAVDQFMEVEAADALGRDRAEVALLGFEKIGKVILACLNGEKDDATGSASWSSALQPDAVDKVFGGEDFCPGNDFGATE